ncbi:hypothetical protein COOONC_21031 [Cooperia oncophora]
MDTESCFRPLPDNLSTILPTALKSPNHQPSFPYEGRKFTRIPRNEFNNRVEKRRNFHQYNGAANRHELINYGDLEYGTKISIGTPPQEFTVALTLSNPYLYVPHPDCKV